MVSSILKKRKSIDERPLWYQISSSVIRCLEAHVNLPIDNKPLSKPHGCPLCDVFVRSQTPRNVESRHQGRKGGKGNAGNPRTSIRHTHTHTHVSNDDPKAEKCSFLLISGMFGNDKCIYDLVVR